MRCSWCQSQNFSSDVNQVAIILGVANCPDDSCADFEVSEDGVRNILFQGPFNPESDPSNPEKPPFQDFTVTIPDFLSEGPSVLSLVQLLTVGVSVPSSKRI